MKIKLNVRSAGLLMIAASVLGIIGMIVPIYVWCTQLKINPIGIVVILGICLAAVLGIGIYLTIMPKKIRTNKKKD